MVVQRLPTSASIGMRVHWAATDCRLCGSHLASAGESARHIQRPYKISHVLQEECWHCIPVAQMHKDVDLSRLDYS